MPSYNSNLNPNVVKTSLDDVFYPEFDVEVGPGVATAESGAVFKQDSADSSAVILEVFKGTGLWTNKPEEQDVPQATPRITNQITFTVTEFAQSVDIPKNFFDDNKHGAYEKMVRDMAETGRITKNQNAFAVYRNAFTTSLTANGVTLVSDSHTTIGGFTVDNKITAALSETSLNTAIVMLAEQKAQDGTIRGHQPAVLLVPQALFKTACEIVDSEVKSGGTNDTLNVYSSKYSLMVMTSPYLGAAAGGSDTAWFLLSRNHSVTRWVRQGIQTDLVDYKFQRNNNYIYKGSFREVVGAISYEGVVGSTGLS
jgi:hypothetical protein